jgi:chromosome segregation ATPase
VTATDTIQQTLDARKADLLQIEDDTASLAAQHAQVAAETEALQKRLDALYFERSVILADKAHGNTGEAGRLPALRAKIALAETELTESQEQLEYLHVTAGDLSRRQEAARAAHQEALGRKRQRELLADVEALNACARAYEAAWIQVAQSRRETASLIGGTPDYLGVARAELRQEGLTFKDRTGETIVLPTAGRPRYV